MWHCFRLALILALLAAPLRAADSSLPTGASLRLGDARLRTAGEVSELQFSPDGTELTSRITISGERSRCTLWSVKTGQALAITTQPRPPGSHVRWSATEIPGTPLGIQIGDDGVPVVRDYAAKKDLARLTGHHSRVCAVAVSPDGSSLATASVDGLIRIWDASTYRPRHESLGHSAPIRSLELSPDGRTLMTVGNDHAIRIWDLASGRERRAFPIPGNAKPEFTADGAAVRIPTPEGDVIRDLVTGLQITSPVQLAKRSTWNVLRGAPVALSPDGRTAAWGFEDGRIELYETATLQVRRTLAGHEGAVRDLTFTPDGNRLISAGDDHIAYVWPVRVRDVPLANELKRETDAATLWSTMAYGRGVESYPAMARLAADPDAAVRMAALCLKPGSTANPIADSRAVELLESLGTVEARALLRELAEDERNATRTRESRAALTRLGDVQFSRDGVRTIGGTKP